MIEIPSPSEIAWLSRRFVMSSESRPASSPFRRFPVSHPSARQNYDRIGEEGQPDLDTKSGSDADRVPHRLQLEERCDLVRALSAGPAPDHTLHVVGREPLELGDLSVRAGDVDGVHIDVTGEPRRELRLEPGEDVHH